MSSHLDPREHDHAALQHEAEHERPPRRKSSVLFYLVILFAAAFLLLLMSYFMQQRANQEVISGLENKSVSAVQSLDSLIQSNKQLQDENDSLQQQVDKLEQMMAELGRDNDLLRATVESQDDWRIKNEAAMDWFWQLDEAYVLGKYTLCRNIIEAMEDESDGQPLKSYLTTESTTDNKRFSPSDRYQEIYNALK